MKIAAVDLHRVLSNALLFVSRDETRPALTCVRLKVDVDLSRLTTTAVDSYKMGEDFCDVTDARRDGEGLLSSGDVKTITRFCRERRDKEVNVVFGSGVITFRWPSSVHGFKKVDATFPDIDKLWPEKFADSQGVFHLSPNQLVAFTKIKPRWFGLGHALRFKSSGADKVILVTFAAANETFRGLLMPVRVA